MIFSIIAKLFMAINDIVTGQEHHVQTKCSAQSWVLIIYFDMHPLYHRSHDLYAFGIRNRPD